ncbi:hypothetical protein PFISCL1PPCAC_29177, partial [Pristionchus fissidentatus]
KRATTVSSFRALSHPPTALDRITDEAMERREEDEKRRDEEEERERIRRIKEQDHYRMQDRLRREKEECERAAKNGREDEEKSEE